MTRYRWILTQKADGFPTTLCCEAAKVSRQAFYDWYKQHATLTPKQQTETRLIRAIRGVHTASHGAYGSPRVTAELRGQGHRVNHKRIERLMRAHQITGITHRRRKRTTTPAPTGASRPADLLRRDFKPGVPNQVWISDITYIATREGWLNLAVVLDLRSRRVLGYQMSDRINTQLVKDALTMAGTHRRGHTRGVVFHSDRGSQYLFQNLQRSHSVLGHEPIRRQSRQLSRQRRRRSVLLHPQTTTHHTTPPIPQPNHSPTLNLRVAQPLQHQPPPQQPRPTNTKPTRTPPHPNHLTGKRGEAPPFGNDGRRQW